MMVFEKQSTGQELIDDLKNLQRAADSFTNVDARAAYVQRELGFMTVAELIGKQMMVSCGIAVMTEPINPRHERLVIQRELLFMAELESYDRIVEPSIPVDSLALNFQNLEFMAGEPDYSPHPSHRKLRVPILAINACIVAESE